MMVHIFLIVGVTFRLCLIHPALTRNLILQESQDAICEICTTYRAPPLLEKLLHTSRSHVASLNCRFEMLRQPI